MDCYFAMPQYLARNGLQLIAVAHPRGDNLIL